MVGQPGKPKPPGNTPGKHRRLGPEPVSGSVFRAACSRSRVARAPPSGILRVPRGCARSPGLTSRTSLPRRTVTTMTSAHRAATRHALPWSLPRPRDRPPAEIIAWSEGLRPLAVQEEAARAFIAGCYDNFRSPLPYGNPSVICGVEHEIGEPE